MKYLQLKVMFSYCLLCLTNRYSICNDAKQQKKKQQMITFEEVE